MSNAFIRDLSVDPRARQARAMQGLEESSSARLLRPIPRIVAGKVNAAGAIVSGGGFTVSKGGVGIYVLTFNAAFPNLPTATASPGISSPAASAQCEGISAGGVQVQPLTPAGAVVDAAFSFIAIGF